jgi:uncharacterized membrane protein YhiD involved in acid resistance
MKKIGSFLLSIGKIIFSILEFFKTRQIVDAIEKKHQLEKENEILTENAKTAELKNERKEDIKEINKKISEVSINEDIDKSSRTIEG